MRAALVASCLRGALPPVDLRAVCLVRAMVPVPMDGRLPGSHVKSFFSADDTVANFFPSR